MPYTAPTPAYSDGAVPSGCFATEFYTGNPTGTIVTGGPFKLENFTPTRPANTITRPDEIGGPNGFDVVKTQETATGVVQVPLSTVKLPQIGSWFQRKLDDETSGDTEQWVVTGITGPEFVAGGYRKANYTFHRAKTNCSLPS